jgi:ribosome biogenesis GTPase
MFAEVSSKRPIDRRSNLSDSLVPYGWNDIWAARFDEYIRSESAAEVTDPRPGRVIRHDGAGLMVAVEEGPVRAMFGPPVEPAPVVGDWVVIDHRDTPVATLARDSLLRRRAAGENQREQPLVANVDVVLVVCGLDRPVRGGRIQRTVAIAIDAGAESIVVLTKADKVSPAVAAEAEMIAHEVDASLTVETLSATGGWGVEELIDRVGDRTVALIGESGAGKSTLVNALMDTEVEAEGDVRAGDAKGRHTTTHRELHLLATGGILVDTPGIREVGVWTDTDGVAETFPEIDELAEQCRFRDCVHDREPGCAVQAALADATLPRDRSESWRDLGAEAEAAAVRADVVEYRRKSRQQGRTYREAQQFKDDQRNPERPA